MEETSLQPETAPAGDVPAAERPPRAEWFSLAATLAVIVMTVVLITYLPTNWWVITRYSDNVAQVEQGLAAVDEEMGERRAALVESRNRMLILYVNYANGIGKPGDRETPERQAELKAMAPTWKALADRTDSIIARYSGATP